MIQNLFSWVVCGWVWKEPGFWCWVEDADLERDRVTVDARSDHHWLPRRQSSAHTTSALSSCHPLQSLPYWVILENIRKKNCLFGNDVTNYSVDNIMLSVLIRFSLNEYCMPTGTVAVWTLDCKMRLFMIWSIWISYIQIYFNKSLWWSVCFVG